MAHVDRGMASELSAAAIWNNVNLGECDLILEMGVLNVKAGQQSDFEQAFKEASSILSSMKGYLSHELHRCLETPGRYLLLVQWKTLEDHTIGFRGSAQYQDWKRRLHHFYEPFPLIEHFEQIDLES